MCVYVCVSLPWLLYTAKRIRFGDRPEMMKCKWSGNDMLINNEAAASHIASGINVYTQLLNYSIYHFKNTYANRYLNAFSCKLLKNNLPFH